MAQLIPVLKKADTNVTHCYVIHIPLILSSFCVYFRHVLSYTFHFKQCSFSYLSVSDENVEAYQILAVLTLLFLHGIYLCPFSLPAFRCRKNPPWMGVITYYRRTY